MEVFEGVRCGAEDADAGDCFEEGAAPPRGVGQHRRIRVWSELGQEVGAQCVVGEFRQLETLVPECQGGSEEGDGVSPVQVPPEGVEQAPHRLHRGFRGFFLGKLVRLAQPLFHFGEVEERAVPVPPTGAGKSGYRRRQLLTAALPTPARRAIPTEFTVAVPAGVDGIATPAW